MYAMCDMWTMRNKRFVSGFSEIYACQISSHGLVLWVHSIFWGNKCIAHVFEVSYNHQRERKGIPKTQSLQKHSFHFGQRNRHDKYFIHVESHSRTREEMCWHCLISMRSFMLHANRVHFVQPAAIICTVLAFCCCYMLVIKIALSANENNRNRNNMTQNAYTHIDSNHSLSLSLSRGHISLENRNLSGKKIEKTTKMLWFIMPV